jgi:hypothetical protein
MSASVYRMDGIMLIVAPSSQEMLDEPRQNPGRLASIYFYKCLLQCPSDDC